MDEQALRQWAENRPEHRRNVARARRLGRPYDGLDKLVERVRAYEQFLAECRNGAGARDASADDARAFVAWFSKEHRVAEGTVRGAVVTYCKFLGLDTIAAELDRTKSAGKDWWADLIRKRNVRGRLSIPFVRDSFDLTMEAAMELLERWDRENRKGSREDWITDLASALGSMLHALDGHGVGRLSEFVELVSTEDKATRLARDSGLALADLRKLLQWVDWLFLPERKHLAGSFHSPGAG